VTPAVKEQAKNEDGSLKVDEEGNPVMEVVTPAEYKDNPDAKYELTNTEEPDWKVVTEGQQLCFESTNPEPFIKEGVSNTNGYDSAFDLIDGLCTTRCMGFKGVGKTGEESDPSTGRVESTKAFAAPFDVVVFIRNNKTTAAGVVIQKSADGKTWEDVAEAPAGSAQRSVKRTRCSVEGEGNYYIRVHHTKGDSQIQDIIILNNGEDSKKYTGIEDVIATEGAEVIAVEYYNLNGVRIAEPTEGFFIKRATLSNGKVVVEKVVK
ncbi:MAG: hypothetical protein K2K72_06295, partial [Duncaniella sp.]|nr:hypothetical protein [Duncaniella sp.]